MAKTTCEQVYLDSLKDVASNIASNAWHARGDDLIVKEYIDPNDESDAFEYDDWEQFVISVVEEDGVEGLLELAQALDELIDQAASEDETNDAAKKSEANA